MGKFSSFGSALYCALAVSITGCSGVPLDADQAPVESTQLALGPGPTETQMGYNIACNEYEDCLVGEGGRYMAFWYGGKAVYKYFPAGVMKCNRDSFGGSDPWPGQTKACLVSAFGKQVSQNSRSTASNQFVAYGRDGKFYFKKINGSYTCNDSTFGNPISGTKACYTAVPTFTYKVMQGGSFDVGSSTYLAAYGVDGWWITNLVTGNVTCNSDSFNGGDPYWPKQKACYILDKYRIATEGEYFNLSGSCSKVSYVDSWGSANEVGKSLTSGYCNNSTFGGDPSPGHTKYCFARCQW
jgi:hypothetical protein